MRCDRCGAGGLTVIKVQLGDGSQVELTSCHVCEARVWRAGTDPLSLAEVLQLASVNRPR